MLKHFILILWICAICRNASGRQMAAPDGEASSSFSEVIVKRRTAGKICDTCKVSFTLNAESEFSYVITGSERTPHRFSSLWRSISKVRPFPSTVHLISNGDIGITFLPNFLQEKGKRIQLYRNFGGEDYNNLEFRAEQKGRIIKQWTPLSILGENKEYAILGKNHLLDRPVAMPWKRTFYAGSFHLNIKDSLIITVRNISTKKIIQELGIIRPEDKATNFIYYQVPLTDKQFSINLQNILNTASGIPVVYRGDSSSIFEKDYGTIGLLRFGDLNENEVIQYSFEKKPDNWQSVRLNGPAAFIVLSNDMQAGKDHDLYLRYESQPETVHRITIRVKEKPIEIPWGKIATISILLLAAGGIGFYLWNKRNKQKLAELKRKNEDVETRLSLLSGQLNPHFLFNSLNAIQGTINSNNPDRANAYIGNVAGFMRDVMDTGKKEFVSLQEELKIEKDYLKLEQERMFFSYDVTIATGIEPSLIDFPPLLLQPVLENSIRHAFSKELPNPVITINISRDNTCLCVEVSDNGSTSWNSDGVREGHGLSLTRKRIAVYNEKLESMSIGMQINYQQGRGTVTTFTFQNWLA